MDSSDKEYAFNARDKIQMAIMGAKESVGNL